MWRDEYDMTGGVWMKYDFCAKMTWLGHLMFS